MAVVPVQVAVSTTVPTLTLAAGSAGGLAVASTIDPVNDYIPIYTASATATQGINRNTYLGLSSAPVGISDSQTLTNKVIGVTNTITGLDSTFSLQDNVDATKKLQFQLSGITTGNTRTLTVPDASDTLVGLATAQTLTNKTITSPTITSPTITNATVSADVLTGFTTSNTGTIYGVSVTGGKISGASLTNSTVGPNQLATGGAANVVATAETTTSTTFADLATVGPAVTVTIGVNGLAMVYLYCAMSNTTTTTQPIMSFAASGANTIAANANTGIAANIAIANGQFRLGTPILLTGLSAGSTIFTAKYLTNANTATFSDRRIAVIPL